MSTYLVSSQQDPRRCGNCGAPLAGRFSPCLACHSVAIEGYGASAVPAPTFPPKRPARQIWHRPSHELIYPYDSIDEAEMVARGNRRSRAPMVLAASVLAVSSAIYLGFVIADGSRDAAPVAASGNVSAPDVDGAARSAGTSVQMQTEVVAQRSATGAASGSNPTAAAQSGQRDVAMAKLDSQRAAVASGDGLRDGTVSAQTRVVAQQPAVIKPQPAVVAQQPSRGSPTQPASVQQQPAAAQQFAAQKPAMVVAQRPAVVASSTTKPVVEAPSAQHSVALAALTPQHGLASQAIGPVAQSGADVSKSLSGAVDQQQPVVISRQLASLQTSNAVSPSGPRPVVSTGHGDAAPATSIADKSRAEPTQSQRQEPRVVAQEKPVVVAQRPVQIQAPTAAPATQRVIASITPDVGHASGNSVHSAPNQLHVDAAQLQLKPVVAAQPMVTAQYAQAKPSVTMPSAQHLAALTTPNPVRAATAEHAEQITSTANTPYVDASKSQPQPRVIAQQQLLSAQPVVQVQSVQQAQSAQATHPVRALQSTSIASASASASASTAPTPATPTGPLHVTLTTAATAHAVADQPMSAADKQRAESAKYLKAARVNLRANNLSATRSRLAAAIAVEPDNRDALRMRSAVHTLELQRDAILNLARGCGYIGHWACMSHNANIALQIDSSSKEAQRLSNLAMHEAELQIAPPADGVAGPLPDTRFVIAHH